jgi:GNAT superfamily N-acetyltransferase
LRRTKRSESPSPSGERDGGTLELREATVGVDDDAVTRLLVEYLAWAGQRLLDEYSVDDLPTDPSHVPQSLGEFRRPRGVLLLALCDGQPAGVGALRCLSDGIVEVKRMYVVPGCRGRHVGSAILDRLIGEARTMGAAVLRLDTCRFMSDAQRLYRSRGFVERGPHEGTEIPPRLQHHWLFFERRLFSVDLTRRCAPDISHGGSPGLATR